MITIAKNHFLHENIDANKGHPQQGWESLNQLGCNNKLQKLNLQISALLKSNCFEHTVCTEMI